MAIGQRLVLLSPKRGCGSSEIDLAFSQSCHFRRRSRPYNANVLAIKQFAKAAAKRVLPDALLRELQQYRSYEKDETPLYLRIRILNGMGLASPKRVRPPKTARSFVFVCFGNIMRSPMCEALMNQALDGLPISQISVTSAGLNATAGRAAHPWAVAAAREFGVSLERHRARILTSQMVDEADAIFTMDYQNHVQFLSRWEREEKGIHAERICRKKLSARRNQRSLLHGAGRHSTVLPDFTNLHPESGG
jgi:protein-tyrosine-phosphatase